nr:hypothetical protein BaRGS_016797 [Batillaria attramentaria]
MSESGTRTSSSSSGLRYKDKVTIVTGGHRGIGKGIVDVFVQNGANVVFCSNDDAGGRSAEASLQALGPGTAEFVFCELTKEADIKNLIDVTVKKYGRIDCLVNNAGTHPPHLPIDDFTAEDFRQLLDVNVVSFFLTSKVN